MNVRERAVDVLCRTGKTGFVDEALAASRTDELSSRDRAFLTELVYGTTRWRLKIDFLIKRLTAGKRIDPRIRQILRVAVHEILHLRTPAYAAVNEAVRLCRKVSSRSGGFANAVLRRLDAEPPKLPVSPPARRLSVGESHPEWLVARWLKNFGEEKTGALCRAGNRALPVTARVRSSGEVVDVKGNPADYPEPIQVQDPTQMKVAPALDPKPGERVLDLCAAPGGKTLHCSDLMRGEGEITAVDVSPERLRLVEEHALPNVRVVASDGRSFSETGFDAVLVDAPCSNTGVLSRRADARWRLRPEDIAEKMPLLQRELLESALRAVRPGGRLIYATCSIEVEENDGIVQAFCLAHEGISLRRAELTLPGDRAAGGFLAVMTRDEAE